MRVFKCEECNEEFDYEYAEGLFAEENPLRNFENFRRCLCSECANMMLEDMVEGEYFEICDNCGVKFDFAEASHEFETVSGGVELTEISYTLCPRCAMAEFESWPEFK